ncbi:peptidoglycan-binding protein [Streptomyces sp. NBC_01239]|uniref:peptidoglycan-binding protein n=1 Tax=Streptomyces sp. NBC_01239 TaxID=2903792 RepID=UPI0022548A93|nr:peptidoglycan-binding protein [Streptomyces sp. NBC_01239]MCX4811798.1 peptidoglycan-binding protein [Streptomyces sp. NBC_01239]
MSRWKVLPEELDPRVRQLVVRLRRLKDHSGLSIRQLAARTGYSPKSWERYLGARALPPAEALEALAQVCGEDPTRLLALREVAAEGWLTTPERPLESSHLSPPEQSPRSPERRALRVALVAGSVTLVLAVSSAVLVTVRIMNNTTTGSPTTPTRSAAPLAEPTAASPYPCHLERIGARWYAGNSRTQQENLAVGDTGPEVAEAQCLLRRAGISPGGIDGIFGPLTEHAVKQFQQRSRLVVDGMVGPHTWKALRA